MVAIGMQENIMPF